jgi:hypothetical protein
MYLWCGCIRQPLRRRVTVDRFAYQARCPNVVSVATFDEKGAREPSALAAGFEVGRVEFERCLSNADVKLTFRLNWTGCYD